MRTRISPLALIAVAPAMGCKMPDQDALTLELASTEPNKLPRSWLKGIVSVEAEENKLFKDCDELAATSSNVPCMRWKKLKDQIRPGDEVWYWESKHNERGDFSLGYCLLRNQSIVYVAHIAYAELKAHK